jgi:hypothetical protein
MSSMPWVKVYTEMLDDVKLAELTDAQKWRFIQLILYAAECDAAGALVTGDSPVTHTQVTWRLRCDKNELESDIKRLAELGLITDNGVITIAKFAERQGPTQAEKRQQWQKRQENRRSRVKNDLVTRDSPVTHANVTPLDKSRVDKNKTLNNGAKAPSKFQETQYELANYFMQATGLQMPADYKAKQKLWWTPAGEIYKNLAGEDIGKAKDIIDRALSRLRGKVTLADMNSIIKTCRAICGEDHAPDAHHYIEVE